MSTAKAAIDVAAVERAWELVGKLIHRRPDPLTEEMKREWARAFYEDAREVELQDLLDGVRRCSRVSRYAPELHELLEASRLAREDRRGRAVEHQDTATWRRELSTERHSIWARLCAEIVTRKWTPGAKHDDPEFEDLCRHEVDRRMGALFGVRELPREQWGEMMTKIKLGREREPGEDDREAA